MLPYRHQQQTQTSGLSTSPKMSSLHGTTIGVANLHLISRNLPDDINVLPQGTKYEPVRKHWFYKKTTDTKKIWLPFSRIDSNALEENFLSTETDCRIVHTDGGRFDVDVVARTRNPVYWTGKTEEIRRCSWFYKTVDVGYVPYDEAIAELLEEEYRVATEEGIWQRKITLPDDETIAFHSPTVMVHFFNSQDYSIWKNSSVVSRRPRVLRRGIDEFEIEEGENLPVDHVLFLVHGIGAVCDLKMRTVEEVVDDFRCIANQLIQSHYKTAFTNRQCGRIEVLPISWHNELHSDSSGIDEKLKTITLGSIQKLRSYTNDTILDVLFYTSPVFCQAIINIVGNSLNRIYKLFCERNTNFKGGVSLGGHSLGSLILFDLLCHQNEEKHAEIPDHYERPSKKQMGAGQPDVIYPELIFKPMSCYALGSPIGMFVTIRGITELGVDFELPTCKTFYNIFHPYDPVAYRIEPLVNADFAKIPPILIPHHKGRKRIHLELKETITQVRGNIKQKFTDTIKDTVETISQFVFPKSAIRNGTVLDVDHLNDVTQTHSTLTLTNCNNLNIDDHHNSIGPNIGRLNKNQRIDYVLQEAPLEYFNEYLFALTSHVCYWESEDTILFIVKDIYTAKGIYTDKGAPQHTLNIERDIRPVSSAAATATGQTTLLNGTAVVNSTAGS